MLQRIGRYEILERIATGGQGTVYRARDTVLDRVVAVKAINQPVTDDPQYLEALQREARLAAGLDHPNITTVYDFQVEGDNAYGVTNRHKIYFEGRAVRPVRPGNSVLPDAGWNSTFPGRLHGEPFRTTSGLTHAGVT